MKTSDIWVGGVWRGGINRGTDTLLSPAFIFIFINIRYYYMSNRLWGWYDWAGLGWLCLCIQQTTNQLRKNISYSAWLCSIWCYFFVLSFFLSSHNSCPTRTAENKMRPSLSHNLCIALHSLNCQPPPGGLQIGITGSRGKLEVSPRPLF